MTQYQYTVIDDSKTEESKLRCFDVLFGNLSGLYGHKNIRGECKLTLITHENVDVPPVGEFQRLTHSLIAITGDIYLVSGDCNSYTLRLDVE